MRRIEKAAAALLILLALLTGCARTAPKDAGTSAPTPETTEAAAAATEAPAVTEAPAKTPAPATAEKQPFAYIHDPRDNPEAMKDIVENPDAVYGFSPDPASTRLGSYAEACDWTDPAVVAENKEARRAYQAEMASMTDILYEMRAEGASLEEMARAVSAERNRLRLDAYKDDPEGLERLKKSNLETYGHEEGPTPDELFETYGSWEMVIQKAFSPNLGMDVCCGLYDENYELYVELGLAAPDPVEDVK